MKANNPVPENNEINESLLLREKLQKWNRFAQNLPDPIARFGRDLRFTYVNNAFLAVSGLVKENVIGKRNDEIMPGKEWTREWMAMLQRVLETGQPEEMAGAHPNGHMLTKIVAEYDNNGLIEGLVAIGRNITIHNTAHEIIKQKEEMARQTFDKFRAIFNSVDEGFAILELLYNKNNEPVDFIYKETNPAFIRQVGVDLKGKRRSELNLDKKDFLLEKYDHIVKSGESSHFDYCVNALDGQWFQVTATKIGSERSTELGVIFRNITERKQHERQQQFLIEFSDALRAESNVDDMAKTAVEMLFRHLKVDRCYISEVFEEQGYSTVGPEMIRSDQASMIGVYQLSDYPETMRQLMAEQMVVHDSETDPRFSDNEKAMLALVPQRALLVAPLRKGSNNVIWALAVSMTTPRKWTVAEQQLLEDLAERTWSAMERAKAQRALTENEEKQRFLLSLSDAVRHIQDPLDIQRVAMKFIAEKLDVSRAGYYELDNDEDNYTVTAWYDRGPLSFPQRGKLSGFDPGLIEKYRSGQTIALNDSEQLPNESLRSAYRAAGVRSWVVVTLVKEGRLLTAIGIHSPVARNWSATELQVLEDVAERTWASVERAKAENALRHSKEKYKSLFNSMDEGYCIIQMLYRENGQCYDWRYLEVNPAFERHNGILNATGKTIRELVPDIEEKWIHLYNRVAETGESIRFEEDSLAIGRVFDLFAYRIGQPEERKVAVLFTNISERKKAENARRESEQKLKELNEDLEQRVQKRTEELTRLKLIQEKEKMNAIIFAQEQERSRIGEGLHNVVAQLLFAAQTNLQLVETLDAKSKNRLNLTDSIMTDAIRETRNISFELMPPALRDYGLKPAIEKFILRIFGADVKIHFSVNLKKRLSEPYEISIYRILQQTLNNIKKHSGATVAVIDISETSENIIIKNQDNGKGFSLNTIANDHSGMGVRNIENRVKLLNGEIKIDSKPGEGTSIEIRIPKK